MTTTETNINASEPPQRGDACGARRVDLVLKELWEVKAQINAEAQYSLEKIFVSVHRSAAEHSIK